MYLTKLSQKSVALESFRVSLGFLYSRGYPDYNLRLFQLQRSDLFLALGGKLI